MCHDEAVAPSSHSRLQRGEDRKSTCKQDLSVWLHTLVKIHTHTHTHTHTHIHIHTHTHTHTHTHIHIHTHTHTHTCIYTIRPLLNQFEASNQKTVICFEER